MPSKKSARKQREKNDEDWLFIAGLEQFKKDGTGSAIEDTLLKEFPLFYGKAPVGHPYPQAFKEGALSPLDCLFKHVASNAREQPVVALPALGEDGRQLRTHKLLE